MAHDSEAARRRRGDQDDDFMDKAACKGKTNLFFADSQGDKLGAAKRICYGECPVRQECLDFAIATNPESGVWGGMTRNERRDYIRQQRRRRVS